MKLELKAVKYFAAMSEETHCYSANLYANGRMCAEVGNRGHGGCDELHITNESLFRKVQDYIAKLPETEIAVEGVSTLSVPQTLDGICGELMNEWHNQQEVKKLKRKHAVVALHPDGDYRVWDYPPASKGKKHAEWRAEYRRVMEDQVRDKRPELTIL